MIAVFDTYPFNLVRDLVGEVENIYIPGIEEAVNNTLTEREADIIRRRYARGETLQKCAAAYGLGRERIRQIQSKALRKLRHPSRTSLYLAVSVAEHAKLTADYQQLERDYELLKKAFEHNIGKPADPGVIISAAESSSALNKPLTEHELSVRSYNCLARANIKTLREITELTLDDMKKIRNLGRKSLEEITLLLKNYGLKFKGE